MRPFLDHFKFRACFSLNLTLHSLENLVTAHCFPEFGVHLAKFSQLKFRESVQFMNIAKILPRDFSLFGILSIQVLVYTYCMLAAWCDGNTVHLYTYVHPTQHNILWDDLTAREHMRMFALLKGIGKQERKKEVKQLLENVQLDDVSYVVMFLVGPPCIVPKPSARCFCL